MVRVLALIAFVGFVLSMACLSAAAAIGGRDIAAHGWSIPADWHIDIDDDDDSVHIGHDGVRVDAAGPTTTREIAWTGDDALEVSVPAEVRYTQGPGPAKLVVTGPKGAVDHLQLDGGRLGFDSPMRDAGRLTIIMTAPNVTRFALRGDDKLVIAGFDKDRLSVDMSGSGEVIADGRATDVDLDISGSGTADLGRLASDSAKVEIAGSGRATIAPRTSAELDISGSGEVTLLTHPTSLRSDVSGSGRIIQAAPGGAAEPARK